VVAIGAYIDEQIYTIKAFEPFLKAESTTINVTCERCAWLACPDRKAQASIYHRKMDQQTKKLQIESFLKKQNLSHNN